MKSSHVFLLAGLMTVSCSSFAAAVGTFLNGPAPAQEYHAVGGAQQPTVISQPAAPVMTDAKPAANDDAATQSEITELTQNTLSFEQQANQRIQDLTDSNRQLASTVQTLMQSLGQMQQQLSQHSASAGVVFAGMTQAQIDAFLLGAAAIFLLGSGMSLGRHWRRRAKVIVKQTVSIPVTENSEGEYDFMNTTQAIPAKLDLARSYIAMNDLDQAKSILRAVLEQGDGEQKQEAKTLMQRMGS
jgi:FimV-like protein